MRIVWNNSIIVYCGVLCECVFINVVVFGLILLFSSVSWCVCVCECSFCAFC